jgi:predicted Zn-dependent protease
MEEMPDHTKDAVWEILGREFEKYLSNVRNTCIAEFQKMKGTRHELAARTAAQLASDLYRRWAEAYDAAVRGTQYSFPSEITVEKEEETDDDG